MYIIYRNKSQILNWSGTEAPSVLNHNLVSVVLVSWIFDIYLFLDKYWFLCLFHLFLCRPFVVWKKNYNNTENDNRLLFLSERRLLPPRLIKWQMSVTKNFMMLLNTIKAHLFTFLCVYIQLSVLRIFYMTWCIQL